MANLLCVKLRITLSQMALSRHPADRTKISLANTFFSQKEHLVMKFLSMPSCYFLSAQNWFVILCVCFINSGEKQRGHRIASEPGISYHVIYIVWVVLRHYLDTLETHIPYFTFMTSLYGNTNLGNPHLYMEILGILQKVSYCLARYEQTILLLNKNIWM